ncbi:MAG TPA: hypothetical protein VGP31_06765 [Planosporangium sp.]|jgi:hypothetical protein|nr:hypothetical protein [Planosporangium sp.]
MRARRRWAPVATAFTNDSIRVLPSERRKGAGATWPVARNGRYVSSRVLLDADRSSPRFVSHASIEGWREAIRRDGAMRAALLNPAGYLPHRR